MLPEYTFLFNSLLIIVIYLGVLYYYRYKINSNKINYLYLIGMFFESAVWSFILYSLIIGYGNFYLAINGNSFLTSITLSIGAGIWEELFFRLILINLLFHLFIYVLKINKVIAITISIFISSVMFSASHYLIYFGQEFDFTSFLYRGFSGIFLGILYLVRGYGITVYCHIFFDLFITLYPIFKLVR